MDSRWLEVGARRAFFLRWIKEADHLYGSLGHTASKECFCFEPPSKDGPDLEEITKLLHRTLHIKSLDELNKVQSDLFSLIPDVRHPESKGFVEKTKTEENKYQLTAGLRELGYAELATTLTPDDLDCLPANVKNSHIIERTLQVAPRSTSSAWCKTLLKLPDNDWLLLFGALLGLSQRADLGEGASVTGLLTPHRSLFRRAGSSPPLWLRHLPQVWERNRGPFVRPVLFEEAPRRKPEDVRCAVLFSPTWGRCPEGAEGGGTSAMRSIGACDRPADPAPLSVPPRRLVTPPLASPSPPGVGEEPGALCTTRAFAQRGRWLNKGAAPHAASGLCPLERTIDS